MYQLVYISTAKSVEDAEIERILAQSRRNNQRDEVTGLLLYNGRRFLQALEGPSAAVYRTYERIRADERHRAAVMLSSKMVEQRQFGNWEMACERVNVGGAQSSLIKKVDALVAGLSDPTLRAQFTSYVRLHTAV
jgi:hypothetical protein